LGSQNKYVMHVWNSMSGSCDLTITTEDIFKALISIRTRPDGQIVTGASDGLIQIWN